MSAPKVLVLRAAGTNCDRETAHAFELCGAETEIVHVNRLLQEPGMRAQYKIFALPGGFSYGDAVAAGRVLAVEL
ncbi:MAG: phosphoribosylformylglycinamidine synthase subunit PurQ, partial [Planctomycetota bacterium]|nr:phosphoribosylformylglycinamidine synthase subunit PurQ [Planctomycetota bacterium]